MANQIGNFELHSGISPAEFEELTKLYKQLQPLLRQINAAIEVGDATAVNTHAEQLKRIAFRFYMATE